MLLLELLDALLLLLERFLGLLLIFLCLDGFFLGVFLGSLQVLELGLVDICLFGG